MRTRTLEDQIRESAQQGRALHLPTGQRTSRKWPLCQTCFKEVDAVHLRDVSYNGCEIVAECCHIKGVIPEDAPAFEDYYRVTWDIPVRDRTEDPLTDKNVGWAVQRAMSDFMPFSPKHHHDFSSKRT